MLYEDMTSRIDRLREELGRRILVLDGAMGTMIQSEGLAAADFGGPALEGCNEHLNLTRPDVIRRVHGAYLTAGADLISTNTFGCAPGCWRNTDWPSGPTRSRESEPGSRARWRVTGFVVGALGPSTRSISVTRNIGFDEVKAGYALQAAALIEGGVDVILLETSQDTLNVKAAASGCAQAMREAGVELPLMLSATIEPMGSMLAGQGVEAFAVSVEHLTPFSVGLNCATGPEFMTDHLRSLAGLVPTFVSVYPNAGLPDERGQYAETPQSLALKLRRFVDEGWVNLVGGCCGTTPAHIGAIAEIVRGPRAPPTPRHLAGSRERGRRPVSGRRQPAALRG